MATHRFRLYDRFYEPMLAGEKTFEVRRLKTGDKNIEVGDTVEFAEYAPGERRFTKRRMKMRVTYVLDMGHRDVPRSLRSEGVVVFAVVPLEDD